MPASMISAPTGSMPKVIGSNMVMVAIGPTPGSTPIKVPIRQPRKHSQRFLSVKATPRPRAKLEIRSNVTGAFLSAGISRLTPPKSGESVLEAGIGVDQRAWNEPQGIEGNGQAEQFFEH